MMLVLLVVSLESNWNVMVYGDARQGKWKGNWRMEWVASTLHTTSEHGVSSITTADAHTSAASSRLNWRPRRFKWTRPFRRKNKSGFCVCAITFQTQSTSRPDLSRNTFCTTEWKQEQLQEEEEEETEGCRELHKEKLHYLVCPQNIIRVMISLCFESAENVVLIW